MTAKRGAEFVSAHTEGGRVVLTRDDGTTTTIPNIRVAKGTAIAGPGGSVIITLAGEE